MRQDVSLTPLTVASSGTQSNAVDRDEIVRQGCRGVTIQAPGTLPEVATIQISLNDGTAYADWQSPPGTDITVAAGKAITIDFVAYDKLRIELDGAAGDERVFLIRGCRDY